MMNMGKIIIEQDPLIREKLTKFLDRMGFASLCDVVDCANSEDVLKLTQPIRLGALLNILKRPDGDQKILSFGDCTLDTFQNLWMCDGSEPIRLTEKETLLLRILKNSNGRSVGRKELLEKVWDYADGVETHTLETHIYRLRQKIEADPAKPKIIITDDDGGYFLNV